LRLPRRNVWRGLGYANVHVSQWDGSLDSPTRAPYDAILITAAAPEIPRCLRASFVRVAACDSGGSQENQELLQARRKVALAFPRPVDCRFVPLLGRYGWTRPDRKPS